MTEYVDMYSDPRDEMMHISVTKNRLDCVRATNNYIASQPRCGGNAANCKGGENPTQKARRAVKKSFGDMQVTRMNYAELGAGANQERNNRAYQSFTDGK